MLIFYKQYGNYIEDGESPACDVIEEGFWGQGSHSAACLLCSPSSRPHSLQGISIYLSHQCSVNEIYVLPVLALISSAKMKLHWEHCGLLAPKRNICWKINPCCALQVILKERICESSTKTHRPPWITSAPHFFATAILKHFICWNIVSFF